MQEENHHSLQIKQRAGVRRKETGKEENYGHSFFSKNVIEVWLIFSVVLSSAAQQCDSVMLSYSFSCVLSVDTEYSSLCSTEGLCVFHSSVSPTPSPHLPTRLLMATSYLDPLWFWMNSHIPCCSENPLILTEIGK